MVLHRPVELAVFIRQPTDQENFITADRLEFPFRKRAAWLIFSLCYFSVSVNQGSRIRVRKASSHAIASRSLANTAVTSPRFAAT
jgi:hypothetical protein